MKPIEVSRTTYSLHGAMLVIVASLTVACQLIGGGTTSPPGPPPSNDDTSSLPSESGGENSGPGNPGLPGPGFRFAQPDVFLPVIEVLDHESLEELGSLEVPPGTVFYRPIRSPDGAPGARALVRVVDVMRSPAEESTQEISVVVEEAPGVALVTIRAAASTYCSQAGFTPLEIRSNLGCAADSGTPVLVFESQGAMFLVEAATNRLTKEDLIQWTNDGLVEEELPGATPPFQFPFCSELESACEEQ